MAFQIRDDVAGIWSSRRRDRQDRREATSRAENGPFRSSGRSRSRRRAHAARSRSAYAKRRVARRTRRYDRVVEALDALGAREAATSAGCRASGGHRTPSESRVARVSCRDARSRRRPLEAKEERERQTLGERAGHGRARWPGLFRRSCCSGFFLRLLFIGNEGFKTDVSTYVAWAIALSQHGFAGVLFDASASPIIRPAISISSRRSGTSGERSSRARSGYAVLRMLVKLPAILADLGVGALALRHRSPIRRRRRLRSARRRSICLIRRSIYISAFWGQVDSISGGLALLAIYALLRERRLRSRQARPRQSRVGWIVGAWLAFGTRC